MLNSNENKNQFKRTNSKPFYVRLKHQTMSNNETLPKLLQPFCSVNDVIDVFTSQQSWLSGRAQNSQAVDQSSRLKQL